MATSQNALFGRAWELKVTPPSENADTIIISSSEWDPETLRITFEVDCPPSAALWTARITIYNATKLLTSKLLDPGATVSLSAGYQVKPYGVIYEGTVYQALFEREEIVDYKVTLFCRTGLKEATGNCVSLPGSPGQLQVDLIKAMAAAAFTPITIDTIDPSFGTTKLPRPRPLFGNPMKYFSSAAVASNMQTWYGFKGVNLSTMERVGSVSTITYTAATGLIGSPQQTKDGVEFNVLLDPRLEVTPLAQQVNIASATVRLFESSATNAYRPFLDPTGTYAIAGLQFIGDSRGEEWYTHVVGYNSAYGRLAMMAKGDPSAGPNIQLDRRSPK